MCLISCLTCYNPVLSSWNSTCFRWGKPDTTTELVVTVVTFTVPRLSHSPLSISCAVCLRSVCLLLMDVFLDIFPSARDADEREKWIHALEGTILRHTLQQVRATSRPHVPWLHLSQVNDLFYNMLRPHYIFGGCFVTFIPCLLILRATMCFVMYS